MPKFSVVLIAKNEEKTLPKLLASLEDFKLAGGETCLLDTGSTDKTAQIAMDWGCKVSEVGPAYLHTIDEELASRINADFVMEGELAVVQEGDTYFDFASARNAATALASNDWVCTVDADEAVTNFDFNKIDEIIQDPNLAHLEYEFVFAHDQFGAPAIQFRQSKFFNRKKIKWTGLVHEIIAPIDGGGTIVYLTPDIFLLEHWQNPDTSRHSYLKGLAVDCFLHPTNDRNSHYFAREMFWTGRPKSAIQEFQRHLKMGGWLGERSESLIFMGDAYGQLNDFENQVLSYSLAFYLDSSRREPLMKLARFYLFNKNWQAALAYVKGAMEIPWSSFYANNKAHYEQEPYEILYKAYGWLGRIPEAQQAITKALEFQPNNAEFLNDRKFYFGEEKDRYIDKGIEGWMTPLDLQWLYQTAKKAETFVEVGSWAGRSSDAILSGSKGKVWCVDTWQGAKDLQDLTNSMAKQRDMLEVFKKNVGHYSNLNIVHKPSVEGAKDFEDGSVDCCFVDAGHTKDEVAQDIKAWLPKVKKGGILCGHDYLPNTWMGVVEAVDEAFGKPDEIIDWIWVHYVK